MNSYNRKDYIQEHNIIDCALIGGLFFFQFCPITNITIRFVLLLVVLFSCLFQKSFHLNNNVRLLIFIILISIFLALYHGLAVAKDFFIFCYGILSTFYIAKKYTFTGNIIYKYFVYVIIPLGVINQILYHNVYYLPFTTGHVNIIGNGATKHWTAIVGTLLFVGSAYNIIKSKKNILYIDIVFFLLSLYLVFFSGSRSCLLALIATIILYFINRSKYKKRITILYFIVFIVSVFFMEYMKDYIYIIENEYILDLLGAQNFKQYGVTSGRAWLWNYHWDSFINSPYLLGGGRKFVDFRVGDYIPFLRMRVTAGSESPYTAMLACNGIIAFIPFSLLLYLSYQAIKKENLIATCIIFICIYNSVMGVDLTNVLQASPILLYLLYFSSYINKK